ncbi:MAG TPA: hypothetical protein VGM07_02540 [Stellaceae bacterium]
MDIHVFDRPKKAWIRGISPRKTALNCLLAPFARQPCAFAGTTKKEAGITL